MKLTKAQQRAREGNCPRCGEFAYPYYLCWPCRIKANVLRVLNKWEKGGLVNVTIDPKDGKKMYGWKKGVSIEHRKYSPEYIARLQLPRLRGKPMTDDVLREAIVEVLTVKNYPMSTREIEKGIKDIKTIGKVVPDHNKLITEYKLIQQRKSSLSSSQRHAVEYKVKFLIKRGVFNDQLQIL